MTTTSQEYAKEIAQTIYAQLGGNKFTTMTGAKLSYTINDKQQPVLKCRLPTNIKITNNKNKIKYLKYIVHLVYNNINQY